MKWISVKDGLPEPGKYVIARHSLGTWHDSDDKENVNCVIVKLVMGLSAVDRQKMIKGEIDDPTVDAGWCLSEGHTKCKRSRLYKSEDEEGNNKKNYKWEMFGPGSFNGQEITHWMPLSKPPITR
jgi:hypothetical protein